MLGTLVTGFLAGVGAFQWGLEFTNQEIVSKDRQRWLESLMSEAQNAPWDTAGLPAEKGTYKEMSIIAQNTPRDTADFPARIVTYKEIPIIDRSVTELQKSTISFFADMKSGTEAERAYMENKSFYSHAQVIIGALILRAEDIENNSPKKPLTDTFKALKVQYQEYENFHKKVSTPNILFFEISEKLFNRFFRVIDELILESK